MIEGGLLYLGMAKVASHAAKHRSAISQSEAALFKAQADAGPNGAESLECQCLGAVQLD